MKYIPLRFFKNYLFIFDLNPHAMFTGGFLIDTPTYASSSNPITYSMQPKN